MDRLWQYWNSLSPNQAAIAVTVIGGIILAALGFLGKFSLTGLKHLFGISPPVQPPLPLPPPPQPITIKLEHSQLATPVQLSQEALVAKKKPFTLPEIPRTPAVGFVARRDREGRDILTQLKEKLGPKNNQLIVLWGPGGVGKTRLASEAAHALKEAFANRIVWVSADGRSDFALATLLDGIARQLNRPELHQLAPDPKKAQVRELIASDPPLVILDNFETIGSEEQRRCATFLAEEASCPALITTRGMIASNFARNIPIDSMSQDEAEIFLEGLIDQVPYPEPFTDTNRQRIIQVSTANPHSHAMGRTTNR
jgi:hypothetical protein